MQKYNLVLVGRLIILIDKYCSLIEWKFATAPASDEYPIEGKGIV